ncbi:MAG: ADP-ribosylglycohydrolase family protein, partial [Armatimonadota bacterium]|nr:ADP-ribosylglycohydrolase family protein [Armatimonadota bacterium]
MAFGDSLGADTEFMSVGEIVRRWPPNGPQELEGTPIRVTDDTQMALAVGEALLEAWKPLSAATLEMPLRDAFVQWANSPDNNRAPGNTCMTACANLSQEMPWTKATVRDSKGCGANMRLQPVGLLPVDETTRAGIAQFQAALTHGHATALAASDLTASAIAELKRGGQPQTLPRFLRRYVES